MFLRLLMVGLSLLFWGCKSSEKPSSIKLQAAEPVQYELNVQFASMEDVKRVPLQYEKLKMQLKTEVSVEQHIYLVAIECHAYAIDGVLEKLNLDNGVLNAERVE
jgi:ABC-type phosphate/phosphonate transport system substrate-binding protein